MRDLLLTFLPRLYLASLALLAGCDSEDGRQRIIDISSEATIEQPGNESEHVVHMTFHRDVRLAKRSLNISLALLAEAQAPVEHVQVGELVPENERDAFRHTKLSEFGLTGQVTLTPCPGGVACTSAFSGVVTSSSPAPGEISLLLLGSLTVDDVGDGNGDAYTSPPLLVEFQVAP